MIGDAPEDGRQRMIEPVEPFSDGSAFSSNDLPDDGKTLELHEERLVAHKEMRHVGDVEIRTETDEVLGRLEVDAIQEELEVEHVPVGRVVSEREAPHNQGDTLVVPVYEEQLVVTKRLVLREELHIRRVANTERQLFEEPLRRERLVVERSGDEGTVRERYPNPPDAGPEDRRESFLENLRRKVMTP